MIALPKSEPAVVAIEVASEVIAARARTDAAHLASPRGSAAARDIRPRRKWPGFVGGELSGEHPVYGAAAGRHLIASDIPRTPPVASAVIRKPPESWLINDSTQRPQPVSQTAKSPLGHSCSHYPSGESTLRRSWRRRPGHLRSPPAADSCSGLTQVRPHLLGNR
jgi:hypothetical protein